MLKLFKVIFSLHYRTTESERREGPLRSSCESSLLKQSQWTKDISSSSFFRLRGANDWSVDLKKKKLLLLDHCLPPYIFISYFTYRKEITDQLFCLDIINSLLPHNRFPYAGFILFLVYFKNKNMFLLSNINIPVRYIFSFPFSLVSVLHDLGELCHLEITSFPFAIATFSIYRIQIWHAESRHDPIITA